MSAKLAIVTGANSGLGLHLVKSLYASGTFSSIVMACRSREKAQQAIESIISENAQTAEKSDIPSTTETNLQFIPLDLTNKMSVRNFVEEFAKLCTKGSLRLLVNNAGVMGCPHQLVNGVELHFATNHLGHFHLANLLADYFSPDDARILIITSGFYGKCKSPLSVGDVTSERATRSPSEYYAFSKLANCLHVAALHKRWAQKGTTKVVAIRPGFVRGTDLGRHTNPMLRLLAYPLIWWFSKNLDQGIASQLHCIKCDASDLQSGALYYDSKVEPFHANVNDENAERVWEMSEQLLMDSP